MKIILTKSPIPNKKFRVTFPDGSKTDFGLEPYSDYTRHKNPLRMRSYVSRHGGIISKSTFELKDPKKVHERMKKVTRSTKEDWTKAGIKTPGFWSRWLLWSSPSLSGAKNIIEEYFNVKIV